ncbi:catechol -dioxygenase 1 [Colletotrichum truncatum]|uniref:Catechol -dioxygenase 1 n=1 Tax=Colletotrichum truncatum TaxID=5467 RepID=A0ACC3YIN9_COLTU|nr:catechol -dioxygenase 1 [Colletotrichum truncatum]KAF6794372.1 catechol -dioxygenase 1 [Colletotrichum truncatum]
MAGQNSSSSTGKALYDPDFTDRVIAATGPDANPRLAQIMPSLLRHLHDFAREVDLTVAEWMAGVQIINEAGQMSNDSRNETQLVCDILGLESLVDEITSKQLQLKTTTSLEHNPTSSAILGPFYRYNAPVLPNGSSIVSSLDFPEYQRASTHLSGRVLDQNGKPIAGAVVDIWHTAPNGMYEQQDADQPDMDLRGRFRTDAEGKYSLYCLRPVPYPVPGDGPGGKILKLLDRHPYRPAHLHFIVSADGYRPLTTQLFDSEDKYLENDSVFAVKKDLVVVYKPSESDPKAAWTLDYDFVLLTA